jgi:hypothetical protein
MLLEHGAFSHYGALVVSIYEGRCECTERSNGRSTYIKRNNMWSPRMEMATNTLTEITEALAILR